MLPAILEPVVQDTTASTMVPGIVAPTVVSSHFGKYTRIYPEEGTAFPIFKVAVKAEYDPTVAVAVDTLPAVEARVTAVY